MFCLLCNLEMQNENKSFAFTKLSDSSSFDANMRKVRTSRTYICHLLCFWYFSWNSQHKFKAFVSGLSLSNTNRIPAAWQLAAFPCFPVLCPVGMPLTWQIGKSQVLLGVQRQVIWRVLYLFTIKGNWNVCYHSNLS